MAEWVTTQRMVVDWGAVELMQKLENFETFFWRRAFHKIVGLAVLAVNFDLYIDGIDRHVESQINQPRTSGGTTNSQIFSRGRDDLVVVKMY